MKLYSMESTPPCVQGSTRYEDPKTTKVQIIQLPDFLIPIINCRITIQHYVGWCGTNGLLNEAHAPLVMDKKVVYPTAVQCGHAAATGVLEFHIPSFGTSPRTLVRAELTQGVALQGYSDARSDCRSKRWISPRGQVVTWAILSAHYSILVRTHPHTAP